LFTQEFSEHGNSFTTENRGEKPIEIAESIQKNPTILAIDLSIKAAVIELERIGNSLGIQMEKSAELASKWENIKNKLDLYIKSLQEVSYKKVFTYVAGTIAIVYFIYQCSIYRKLPDFLISIASHIPLPSIRDSGVPVPKPSVESTIDKISNIPLTPLGIITGVGFIVTGLGILRATVWVIRKLRK
jgi:hypothetical protein